MVELTIDGLRIHHAISLPHPGYPHTLASVCSGFRPFVIALFNVSLDLTRIVLTNQKSYNVAGRLVPRLYDICSLMKYSRL